MTTASRSEGARKPLIPVHYGGQPVVVEDSPRRVRVELGGHIMAESSHMKLVYEIYRLPVYYFPADDVRMELATRNGRFDVSPHLGTSTYFDLRAGSRSIENGMWSLDASGHADLENLVTFDWDAMDHWYEEDEEIFVHARDPYHRVDTAKSSRLVKVILSGNVVAESRRTVVLFETGLPTRYYFPAEDVHRHLLVPSETKTSCPYKGTAGYHSVRLGGELYPDIVWHYPKPVPECPAIAGMVCFFNERVDAILVDGVAIPDMPSPWSTR